MSTRILAGTFTVLLCVCLCVQTGFSQQQAKAEKGDEGDMVVLRLNDASLLDVMKMLEGVMKDRTFLYTDKVEQQLKQSRVDLVYGPPIPKKYVFNIFETILRSQNFILKPGGPKGAELVEIMSSQKTQPGGGGIEFPIVGPGEELPFTDKFVMQIVQLQYADVNMVRQQLQNFVGRAPGGIIVIPDANIMIISDFATKLRVIMKIIEIMDRPRIEPEMHMIPIAYRPATEIMDIINRLLQATTQAGTTSVTVPRRTTTRRTGASRTTTRSAVSSRGSQQGNIALEVDEASNTLFLIAPKGDPQVEKIYELIDYLDVLPPEPEPTYHIYKCRYTVAADLVDALEGVIGQTAETTTATAIQPRGAPPRTTAVATRQPISEELYFLPYEPTNSIIVSGPLEKYKQIQPLLEELDVRTAQVLIEGYIVNISSDDSFILDMDVAEFDSSLKALAPNDTPPDTLSVGSPGDTAFQFLSSTGELLLTGITRQKIRFPAILKALQTKADVSIISNPIIVATDNEEATFSSTSQRPFGRFTDLAAGGIGGARESGFGGYEEAGISIGILPTISEDGLKLRINANVSTFRGDPPDPSFPPPREDTNLDTLVTVPDGHTLIIGGIKADSESKSYGRVPILGSIPILKWIFQGRKKNKTRTNLYVFITPHILRDEDFDDYVKRSIEKENEFQRGLEQQAEEDINFKRREEKLDRRLRKYLNEAQEEESGR